MAATTALREALNRGISSGGLVDTKIILYSHRDYSGRVRRPKALYTNSRVLKTVPYFNDLLFGNFAESQSKNFKEAIDEEEYAEDYGYISDSDLEDDEEDKFSFVHNGKPKVHHPSDPFAIPGEDKVACADYEECVEEGKVVKVPDIAFVTFQAFIMYLYTDVIEFAPFGSEEIRRSRKAEIVRSSDDKIPRPSPKSIYRLADKYDVPALKTLALSHIRSGLAKCDIVEESFSIFASRYDEVRKLYIDQLAFVWMEDSTAEATRAKVEEKIDGFSEGDYDHAAETLSALWEIATKDGDAKAPSTATPAATLVTSPENWALVNKALIKSIRRGVFFDRKYWARHSKTGEIFKPVYFSSIIMNDKAPQLDKIVKYLKDEDPLMSDLQGQTNIESDCDQADREVAEQREKERWRRNQEAKEAEERRLRNQRAKEAEERRLRNQEAKEAEERRLKMDRAASWGLEPQVSQYRPEPPKPQPWGDWFTPSTPETAKGMPVGGWLRTLTDTAGLQPERSLTPTEVTLPSSDRKPAPAPALPGPSTPIPTLVEEELQPATTSPKHRKKKKGRIGPQETPREPVRQPTPQEPVTPPKEFLREFVSPPKESLREFVTPPKESPRKFFTSPNVPVQEPVTPIKMPAREHITTFKPKDPAQEEDPLKIIDVAWSSQETEEQIRAVLVTGSFSAWKSIFFYRCTDEISFAPLRSQGVVSRANYIREKTVRTAPPPCSPKSIYVLAELLGIPVLREKAFEDFKKKVTSKTVVGEAFSWVTAGQKEILEMECDLLVSSSKGPSTVALVKDSIRRASDGSSPHCAGALKLGLEKASKSKKESNGVKLRCSHSSCNWYSNHVSYSSIGSGTYQCQMCINRGWGGRCFQCVGCGHLRTSNHTSCQGCRKRFI